MAPTGPVCAMTSPDPKNRPVPIAPPSEIITRCRVLMARFKGAELP